MNRRELLKAALGVPLAAVAGKAALESTTPTLHGCEVVIVDELHEWFASNPPLDIRVYKEGVGA